MEELFVTLGIFIFVIFAGLIAVLVLFLLNLMKLLQACAPENQKMGPGMVWLNLIPIFSLGWMIFTVIKITESLKSEYTSRGLNTDQNFGYPIGLAYAICNACSIIPFVGTFAALGSLVLWIMWWIKTAGFRKELTDNTVQQVN